MQKEFVVYILANKSHSVLYTGFSGRFAPRIADHKEKKYPGFTKRYNVTKLVYFETFQDAESTIAREKQIKAGSRQKKIDLIVGMNPEWKDLSEDLFA
jgi:putative endonuclease